MKIKRLLAAFVAILMVIIPSFVFADKIDDLNALGILPKGIDYSSENAEYATRGEFSQMIARVMGSGAIAPIATDFSDVKADNKYSGYIKYLADAGIVNGTSGGKFSPDDEIDTDAASKMLVCALGFKNEAEEMGGYPSGYNKIAKSLGLYKSVDVLGGALTNGNSALMVHNALLAEVPSKWTSEKGRLLCDVLKISAYRGVMTDTDITKNSATFRVDESVYSQNKASLAAGQEYDMQSNTGVNLTEYERVPLTIWVNENEEIIHIIEEAKTEIVYGYILSINGDEATDGAYDATEMDELMFINNENEYAVSEDVLIKYDGEYTTSTVKLCGNFAKATVVDDEVIFIESFGITEGGIITKITDRNIEYIKGDKGNYVIKDYDLKETIKVYINNAPADIKDLRTGSVFDVCETDKELVVIAMERVLSDVFEIYNAGEFITVGNLICSIKGTLYTSTDGVTFVDRANVLTLLGRKVKVFVAPSGYAKYIVADDLASGAKEFYGIVSAVRDASDGFSNEVEVKLIKLAGDAAEEAIYTISEKIEIDGIDGVTTYDQIISYLKANAGDAETGKNVLVFKANAKGDISKISAPTYFQGTDEKGSGASPSIGSSPEISWKPTGSSVGYTIGYKSGRTIFSVSKVDGNLTVTPLASTAVALAGTGCCFRFYGEGKIAEPEFILAFGDVNSHSADSKMRYGIYTGEVTNVLGADGEILNRITIIGNGEEKVFDVTDEFLSEINDATGGAAYISYMETFASAENPFKLTNTTRMAFLSQPTDEWLDANQSMSYFTLKMGVVDAVAGNRIYFTDGAAYNELYEKQWKTSATVCDDVRAGRFKKAALTDIEAGDVIYYFIDNSGGRIFCWIRVED